MMLSCLHACGCIGDYVAAILGLADELVILVLALFCQLCWVCGIIVECVY